MTTYLGYDVLDSPAHNFREAVSESFARQGAVLENPTGRRAWDDHVGTAVPVRTFLWTAFDRASAVAIRTFLDARKGRAVPFWVPTYCRDLVLAFDTTAAAADLVIQQAGYLAFLWPYTARHYIAAFPKGGTMQIRKIVSAIAQTTSDVFPIDIDPSTVVPVDPDTGLPLQDPGGQGTGGGGGSLGGGGAGGGAGVGVTERIKIDSATGSIWAADTTVISFLVLCRLADDLTQLHWSRPDICDAAIRFQELPREVPA